MSNSRSPRAVRSMTIGISGMRPHPSARWPDVRAHGRNAAGTDVFDDAMSMTPRIKGSLAAAALLAALAAAVPALAMTSHAGWPRDEHLVMDKGPAGRSNVLTGRANVHNYLLGG